MEDILKFRSEKCRNIIIDHFLDDYDKSPYHKKITRDEYYHWIYYSGTRFKGVTSNEALKTKGTTLDHFLTPRLFISAIIETKRDILFDTNKFHEMFELCTEVVKVTKKQNDDVKYKNVDKSIVVEQLTIEKYDNFSPWWTVVNRKIQSSHDEFPLKDRIPKWYLDYEKKIFKERSTLIEPVVDQWMEEGTV